MRCEFEYKGNRVRYPPEVITLRYGTVQDGEEKLEEKVLERNKFGSYEMEFELDNEKMCFYLAEIYGAKKICDENYFDITADFAVTEAEGEKKYVYKNKNTLTRYKIYLFL